MSHVLRNFAKIIRVRATIFKSYKRKIFVAQSPAMTVGCGVMVLDLIVASLLIGNFCLTTMVKLKKLGEIPYIHMLYTPKLGKLLERIRGDPEDLYNSELAKGC